MDPPNPDNKTSVDPTRESFQLSAIDDLLSELDGAPAAQPVAQPSEPMVNTGALSEKNLSAELDAFLEDMAAPIVASPATESPAAAPSAPVVSVEPATPRTVYEDLEAAILDVAMPESTAPAHEEPKPAEQPSEPAVETPKAAEPEENSNTSVSDLLDGTDSPFSDIAPPQSDAAAPSQDAYATADIDYSVAYATDEEVAYVTGYGTESVYLDEGSYSDNAAVYAPSASCTEPETIQVISASVPTGRKWHEEFFALRDLPSDSKDSILAKAAAYKKLATEFISSASSAATTIIQEKWLPDEQMTIKPVNAGGIAGGRKYIHDGMFFKFALDSGMYGSDENAGKAAALELKAVNAIFENYEIIGLGKISTVPIALVDYLGYRVIATPVLPVNSSTLVYGSADAGKTVHLSDEAFNFEMEVVAARLNLKAHLVGSESARKSICGPVDIEGHIGTDGTRYILDTARLMPPEAPGLFDSDLKSHSVWTRHLRPEAVTRAQSALNSDAYTGFNKNPDPAVDRNAVLASTKHIYDVVLPKFASVLTFEDVLSQEFTSRLHEAGLNVRMLGHIRKHAKRTDVKKALMELMLARSFKSLLFEKLRRVKATPGTLGGFHAVVAECLSDLVGAGEKSDKFWADSLPSRVRAKFGRVALEDVVSKDATGVSAADSVRAHITTRLSMFLTATRSCGIQISDDFLAQCLDSPNLLDAPISAAHVARISPVTKVSSNVYGEEGWRAATNMMLLTGSENLDPDQTSSIIDHIRTVFGDQSPQVAYALSKILSGTLQEVTDIIESKVMLHSAALSLDFLQRTVLELKQDADYWMLRLLSLKPNFLGFLQRFVNILGPAHAFLPEIYLSVACVVGCVAIKPEAAPAGTFMFDVEPGVLCNDSLHYFQLAFDSANLANLSPYQHAALLALGSQTALKIIGFLHANQQIDIATWSARLEAYFGKADSPVVACFESALSCVISTAKDKISSADVSASVPAQRALHMLERLYGNESPATIHASAILGRALSEETDQTSKDSALVILEQMLNIMEKMIAEQGYAFLFDFPYFEAALRAHRSCAPATGYERLASFEERVAALLTKYVTPFRHQAAKIVEYYTLMAQSHCASSRVVAASGIELDGDEAIMLSLQANSIMADMGDAWDASCGRHPIRTVHLIDSNNPRRLMSVPFEKRDPLLMLVGDASGTSRARSSYNGEFSNGHFHGTGTLEFNTLMKALTGIESVYGTWQEGLPHGMARVIYVDGSVYEGPIANGLYEGKGIMTNPDGSKYAGPFSNGLMHGSGFFLAAGSTTPVTKHYRKGKETNPDLRARYVTPQRKVSMPDFGAASRVEIPVDGNGNLHGVGSVSWGDTQFCLGVWRRGVLESAVFHTLDGYLSYTIYTSHTATLFFWNRVQTHFGGLFSNPSPTFLPGLISVVTQLLDSMQGYWAQPLPENLAGVELDNFKENQRGWEFGVAPLLRTSAQVFTELLQGQPLDLGNLLNMMTKDIAGPAAQLATPAVTVTEPAAPSSTAAPVATDSRISSAEAMSAAEMENSLEPLRRRARAITPGTPRPPKVAAAATSGAQPTMPPPSQSTETAADARVPSVSLVSTVGAAVAQDQTTPRTTVDPASTESSTTTPPTAQPSPAPNAALVAALRQSVQINPTALNDLFKQEASTDAASRSSGSPQPVTQASPATAGTTPASAGAAKQPAPATTTSAGPSGGMSLAAQAGGLVRQQDKVIILGLPPMKQTVQQQPKNLEGWLHKRGNRGLVLNWTWKWRFFRVSDDNKALMYFKHKENDPNKAKGSIELTEVDRLEENKEFMCAFNVHIKGRTYVLQAQSLDQRKMWLTELQKRCPKVTTTNSFENMHSSMLAAVPQFMRPMAGGAAKSGSTPPSSPRVAPSETPQPASTPSAQPATQAPRASFTSAQPRGRESFSVSGAVVAPASNVDPTSGAAAVAFSPSEPAPANSRPSTAQPDESAATQPHVSQ